MSATQERISANVAAAADTFPQHGGAAEQSPLLAVLEMADARIAEDAKHADLFTAAANQLEICRTRSDRGLSPERAKYFDEIVPELRSAAVALEARGGNPSTRVPTPASDVWELLYHAQDARDEALTRVQELEAELAELRPQLPQDDET